MLSTNLLPQMLPFTRAQPPGSPGFALSGTRVLAWTFARHVSPPERESGPEIISHQLSTAGWSISTLLLEHS